MLKLHPTEKQLQKIYHELASIGARTLTNAPPPHHKSKHSPEELMAKAAHLSRFDPRLFHVLVDYVYHHWQNLNPFALRQATQKYKTAPMMMVIYNFVKQNLDNLEFNYLYHYLGQNVTAVAPQLYFFGLHLPTSRSMLRAVNEPLQEFLDWGFLAREKPIIYWQTGNRQELGLLSFRGRINLARKLAKKQTEFSLKNYLDVIQGCVSRQQAVLDLKKCGYFKLSGKGRGSCWQALR